MLLLALLQTSSLLAQHTINLGFNTSDAPFYYNVNLPLRK
jgi:hypothetical protein